MHKHKKFLVLGVIALGVLCVTIYGASCISTKVCGIIALDKKVRSHMVLEMPTKTISVEVVDTRESRELGLSGRNSLAENSGMLFVFDFPGRYAFWMKDMSFPIDIVWISKAGIVVHVEKEITPESYPETFINTIEATYILELPSGKADEYGIRLAAKIKMRE